MNNFIIKISDNIIFEKFLKKKIFVDNNLLVSTHSNVVKVEKEDKESEVRIEILGGFYATKFSLPKNTSYFVFCENKTHKIFRCIIITICLLLILDVIKFHLLSIMMCHIILWGSLFIWLLFDCLKRKKRYKIKMYEMQ